ncbi:MAG: ComEC/Rec2 family competence protein, partial [Anaerolineae bacterium]|nr:ComEC/Rec2 family competence protein [Anaerolineae bacterium]
MSAAFLAGTAAGDLFSIKHAWSISILLAITGIALILLFDFHPALEFRKRSWQKTLPLTPGWLVLLAALGMLRFASIQPIFQENDAAFYNEQGKAVFTAVVIQPPQVKSHSTVLSVRTKTIHPFSADFETGIQPVNGRMRVTTLNTGAFQYGDELRIICTPETPQNSTNFNYQRYLAARKIYTTCDYAYVEVIHQDQGNWWMKAIFNVRDIAQQRINHMLPPDEAALLSGILLGNEDQIAPEVENAFQRTGTSHIIAISGANFTVLIVFVTKIMLKRLPRRWVLPVSAAIILFYTILVGGNAAVVRAAIMGMLSVFGAYFGRENRALNTLSFSAAVFVGCNPLILWDLGFQLSVGATLGLVLFSTREKEILLRWLIQWLPEQSAVRITNWIGEYALMTISAQIFTLPLIAYTFRHLSLSSFIINIFILPVQPLIMGLGGLAVLIALLLPFIGQVLAWLVWIPLAYTIKLVMWGSAWTWSEIFLPQISSAGLWSFYGLMLFWPFALHWKPKFKRWINQGGLILLLSGIIILIWTSALQRPEENLQLYLFPLEDSTAVLLQLPDGKAVLLGRSDSIDDLNHAIEQVQSGYQLLTFIQPDSGWQAFNRVENLAAHFPIQDVFVNPSIETEAAN